MSTIIKSCFSKSKGDRKRLPRRQNGRKKAEWRAKNRKYSRSCTRHLPFCFQLFTNFPVRTFHTFLNIYAIKMNLNLHLWISIHYICAHIEIIYENGKIAAKTKIRIGSCPPGSAGTGAAGCIGQLRQQQQLRVHRGRCTQNVFGSGEQTENHQGFVQHRRGER